MNYGIVLQVLGSILIVESVLMIPSLFISLYTNQWDKLAFLITILITILITGIIGSIFTRNKNFNRHISVKEGLAIVSLGWLSISLLGALPLYISGNSYLY